MNTSEYQMRDRYSRIHSRLCLVLIFMQDLILVRSLKGHSDQVMCVVFSRDGKKL